MSTEIFWPIACMAAGLVLLILEVFVPSGGLIGLLAVGLLGISLWQAFAISTTVGLAFTAALLGLLPMAIALAVHLWPRTPMGKLIFLAPPPPEENAPDPRPALNRLIGQYGRALTPLRPSGMVDFEGRRLEGQAEEGLIPAGAMVQAVHVRGGRLVVRDAPAEALEGLAGPMDWNHEDGD